MLALLACEKPLLIVLAATRNFAGDRMHDLEVQEVMVKLCFVLQTYRPHPFCFKTLLGLCKHNASGGYAKCIWVCTHVKPKSLV